MLVKVTDWGGAPRGRKIRTSRQGREGLNKGVVWAGVQPQPDPMESSGARLASQSWSSCDEEAGQPDPRQSDSGWSWPLSSSYLCREWGPGTTSLESRRLPTRRVQFSGKGATVSYQPALRFSGGQASVLGRGTAAGTSAGGVRCPLTPGLFRFTVFPKTVSSSKFGAYSIKPLPTNLILYSTDYHLLFCFIKNYCKTGIFAIEKD